MVRLQVALDFVDLERALKVAEEAMEGGAEILEAGTPLIKSEGLEVVRELKKRFPKAVIFADMKTMDTGALETEIACKAGADIVGVLGAAHDETIKEAVKAAHRYGATVAVDLLGTKDSVERAKQIEKCGADFICVHTGIDAQMKRDVSFELLKKVVKAVKVPLIVAGGINSETASEAAKYAEIVVVGGAITKAGDAKKATEQIMKAMRSGKAVKSELYKKYGEGDLRKTFLRVSTPNIGDAMHHEGEMIGVKNLFGMKFAGQAVTVRTYDGDWAKPVEALEKMKEGEVLVIDAQGGRKAVWGELASNSAKVKGIEAVVVDGAVRDVDEIRKMKLPVAARNVASNSGDPKGWGEIGAEIVCGGVKVRGGDWVVGDENGVVVIPKEIAVEIANRAIDVMEREDRLRSEIKKGKTLSEVAYLKKWEKIG